MLFKIWFSVLFLYFKFSKFKMVDCIIQIDFIIIEDLRFRKYNQNVIVSSTYDTIYQKKLLIKFEIIS